MTTTFGAPAALLRLLREKAGRVRALEAEAAGCLRKEDCRDRYAGLLGEKCLLLQELPAEAEELSEGMDAASRRRLMDGLESMAFRAGKALEFNSVFFMANLLYPDAYQKGQPNELEQFIQEFQEKG